jgi:hypothetical protein
VVFSAVGAMEGACALASGHLTALSEEQIEFCCTSFNITVRVDVMRVMP